MIPSKRLLNSNCLVRIKDALFKPDTSRASIPVFSKPIKFEVYKPKFDGSESQPSFWMITGPQKSQFLQILSGRYIAQPAIARSYPFISKSYKYDKIQFLNFRDNSGLDKVYMSARYETFAYKGKLEMDDDVNSVKNYVMGSNNYNKDTRDVDMLYVQQVLELFNLTHLAGKWINSLSNGQMRRARIAKALIAKPDLLLIDDPFLGLDPEATKLVLRSLDRVSQDLELSIVLGLRVQDVVPEWIQNVGFVDSTGLKISGSKHDVGHEVKKEIESIQEIPLPKFSDAKVEISNESLKSEVSHVEFNNAHVIYKEVTVFQHFDWKIPRGTKWRILGDNGTGKTTLISLITADHPQSWRSVLSINGVVRKTGCGVSFFDVNNEIGMSSPELHALVPAYTKSMREVILNGIVRDVGNSNFMFAGKETDLTPFGQKILEKFGPELEAYGDMRFSELTITHQKLALFLRAIIKNPALLVLDEAFSCMDDQQLMLRCHEIVEKDLIDTTVLAIGHLDWEVPKCNYLLKLIGDEKRSYKIYKYIS